MSAILILSLRRFPLISHSVNSTCVTFTQRNAANIASKMKGMATPRKHLVVETDAEKLAKSVCGANIYLEGEDPEIKADSEYPEWLWSLRTDKTALTLEDVEKGSDEYWSIVRREHLQKKAKLKKVNLKYKEFGRR